VALDVLQHCVFSGPALPEPFLRFELEKELEEEKLLPKTTGADGRALQESWDAYRRKLRELVLQGGAVRVRNHVIEPLVSRLGYERIEDAGTVTTREGREAGGLLLSGSNGGSHLRAWAVSLDEDLDAPSRRGAAYRYSHIRIAQRVLLASRERLGLISNGSELRILVSDPARPDSQIAIPIDPHWRRSRDVPDSYRLLLALGCPRGVEVVPELVEKARLLQSRVTTELRRQARQAVEGFVQELLDHPDNRALLAEWTDGEKLARELWREGLIVIYRLLFVLKLESTDDPARAFGFASTSLWRNSFSPSVALARIAREVLDQGAETGTYLEQGFRTLIRMFSEGVECNEMRVAPLGGALFGDASTPLVSRLTWGERSVAYLLDRLLWTPRQRGQEARERVHYGSLDVEDLGRVYETLLELEPGIAVEPMCRLRRQKLEVVVPEAQGKKYRPKTLATEQAESDAGDDEEGTDSDDAEDEAPDDAPKRGKKTKVEWIEGIPPGRFHLRVGLERKASGSYYTPHSFVRFLVQETLAPQVDSRSPKDDPHPGEILKLKVLDPAMGSGHFLVEACRHLGDKLYEACRLCDEKALDAERRAEKASRKEEREKLLTEAAGWRRRVEDLPDPDNELVRYLPSRAPEGTETGLSQRQAAALCRRLVAVHCLYGVDKNPLAVELAKLSLWLESHAEGFPLTFLDHRLVIGDSLTGPFFEHLLIYPGSQKPMDDLFSRGLSGGLTGALTNALASVKELEASVGIDLGEIEAKERARRQLERALAPFKVLAAAWAGGVMLGPENCNDSAYQRLGRVVAETGEIPETLSGEPHLLSMIACGLGREEAPATRGELMAVTSSDGSVPALAYQLTFPEVFFPQGRPAARQGFDAILENPPWDAIVFKTKEFFAAHDFEILSAPTKRERSKIEETLTADPQVRTLFDHYQETFERRKRCNDCLYDYQKVEVEGDLAGRQLDEFRVFMERNAQLAGPTGRTGVVVPSAFHANEGATGVRRLYLEDLALQCCYSFENRRRLFEIDSRFKFALVVASRPGPTTEFPCAFYLHDDEWLFGDRGGSELRYDLDFVRRTGGEYMNLLELRSHLDLEVAEVCFKNGEPFGKVCERLGIRFGRECDMTNDAWRFTPTADILPSGEDPRDPEVAAKLLETGYLVLREGKTFWHYDDHWDERPVYVVPRSKIADKGEWVRAALYFRAAYRAVASSTNERTIIFTLLPGGSVFGNSAPTERNPWVSPRSVLLVLVGGADTFVFDWTARVRAGANINQFILFSCPLPATQHSMRFLRSGALRLTANHQGYEPLWREQLGDVWREPGSPFKWSVLSTEDERWHVRAAIDAVVTDGYGLTREQYAHVLSTFSHASYPKAPDLCLAKFDELKQIGLDAFTKKYDPYWDIPLNESLPKPVIDLPVPIEEAAETAQRTIAFGKRGYSVEDEERPVAAELTPRAYARKHPRRKPPANADGTYHMLCGLLRKRGVITSKEAQDCLGLDASAVRPLLQRLVADGIAVQEGQRRGKKYRLCSTARMG
jgi:hypothetical protein